MGDNKGGKKKNTKGAPNEGNKSKQKFKSHVQERRKKKPDKGKTKFNLKLI